MKECPARMPGIRGDLSRQLQAYGFAAATAAGFQ
jgi:hypothetical protein